MPGLQERHRYILRATLGYAAFATAWIVLSDRLLEAVPDVATITWLATAKGLAFVLITTALLFRALVAVPAMRDRADATRLDATMRRAIDSRPPAWSTYLFAAAVSSLGVAARSALEPYTASSPLIAVTAPIAFGLLPMIASAVLGGIGPGLLSVAVTALGFDMFVVAPYGALKALHGSGMTRLSFVTASGIAIALISESALQARRRLQVDRYVVDAIVSRSTDAVYVKDRAGRYLFCNEAAAGYAGKPIHEILGRTDAEILPGSAARVINDVDQRALEAGETAEYEERLPLPDGRVLTFLTSKGPVRDIAGNRIGLFGIARDITGHRRSEVLQRELSRVLEMIARNAPIGQTLERLVRGIETHSPEMICSVLLFDEKHGCLRHGAAPSLPGHYNLRIDGLAIGPSVGSCGTAAYWRRTVEVQDIRTDPLWADFRELTAMLPYRSCWSQPVFDGAGNLLGTFAVYGTEPGRPTAAQLQLIAAATDTAAVCISSGRAHQSLRESEQRFSRIFETSPIGIALIRADGMSVVDANDAWLRLFRYARADAVGRLTPGLGFWDDPARRADFLEHFRAQRKVQDFEATFRRSDGRSFDGLLCASVVQIAGDDFLLATVSDQTLQKAARRALEDQRQQLEEQVAERTAEIRQTLSYLRTLIDNLPYYIWLKDTQGKFLAVNRAHAESSARTIEQIVGKTDFDIWPADRAEANRAADAEVIATRRTVACEQPYAHVKGTIWVETLKSPVVDADGRVIGTVGFARDISDAKALEMERERARQAAENLARTKSEFLARMSHEIRTPLNGVLGLARIGFQESGGRKSRNIFSRILDSGRLLQGIIDNILDYSKIEAGKLSLESIPIEPAGVIRQVIDLVRPHGDAKGLQIRIDLDDDLPRRCLGDPVRLTQVILNLTSNAIKFTAKGQVVVSACREGPNLVYAVTDSGIGISPAQMNTLFRAFEQADTSTTRRFGGTGLGLAISKRLVELMSGHIEVHSQVGAGSTFRVSLPYFPAPEPAEPAGAAVPARGAAAGDPASGRLRGVRILAAEDGEINRIVLDSLLHSEQAAVVLVNNGREAVERVEAEGGDFDLVLMDIEMPEMDGYEAAQCIVKLAPGLPVIGQTAHALAEDLARCLESGMCDYVTKPLDPEKLTAMILKHARRAQRLQADGSPSAG